jgi:hypothetical protein
MCVLKFEKCGFSFFKDFGMGFGFVAFPGLMAAVNAMCASSGGYTLPSLSAGDFGWPIGSCSSNLHFTGTEEGGGGRRMRSERILRGRLDAMMMMHGSEEGEGDDYTFIDCGAGKRIERFGGVSLRCMKQSKFSRRLHKSRRSADEDREANPDLTCHTLPPPTFLAAGVGD